jgi:hypothetical protein
MCCGDQLNPPGIADMAALVAGSTLVANDPTATLIAKLAVMHNVQPVW